MVNETKTRRRLSDDRRAAHQAALELFPESAGPRLATRRGGVAHLIRQPGSQSGHLDSHIASIMLAPCRVEASLAGDRRHQFDAAAGTILIQPAGWASTMSWQTDREEVVVAISQESLLELALTIDAGSFSLRPPRVAPVDRDALQVARMIRGELRRNTPAELYIESLVTLLGIHLLRRYARPARRTAKGALSLARARRLQEFVDSNLSRKLTVIELAAVCNLSSGHFIRAFTRTFGQRPHEYLLSRRLDFAERLLVGSEMPIAEVADRSGFSSQSHLTSSMKKYRHTTPAQLRGRRSALLPARLSRSSTDE